MNNNIMIGTTVLSRYIMKVFVSSKDIMEAMIKYEKIRKKTKQNKQETFTEAIEQV